MWIATYLYSEQVVYIIARYIANMIYLKWRNFVMDLTCTVYSKIGIFSVDLFVCQGGNKPTLPPHFHHSFQKNLNKNKLFETFNGHLGNFESCLLVINNLMFS